MLLYTFGCKYVCGTHNVLNHLEARFMAKKVPGTSSSTNTGPRRAAAKKKVAKKVPARKAAIKKTNKKGA
jgi:hypothetical protein